MPLCDTDEGGIIMKVAHAQLDPKANKMGPKLGLYD